MNFEWDEAKARANIVKHSVSFPLAIEVRDDPFHVIVPDRIVDGEERRQALGSVDGLKLLVIVHTYRDGASEDVVRIIGARRATVHERRNYEEGA